MTDADRQHLAAILGMLGSEHAGERAAAGLQAEAFRCKHGATWAQLLQPIVLNVVAPQPQPQPPPQPKPQPPPDMPPPPQAWATTPASTRSFWHSAFPEGTPHLVIYVVLVAASIAAVCHHLLVHPPGT